MIDSPIRASSKACHTLNDTGTKGPALNNMHERGLPWLI